MEIVANHGFFFGVASAKILAGCMFASPVFRNFVLAAAGTAISAIGFPDGFAGLMMAGQHLLNDNIAREFILGLSAGAILAVVAALIFRAGKRAGVSAGL